MNVEVVFSMLPKTSTRKENFSTGAKKRIVLCPERRERKEFIE
jgi:hypothetical protein